MVTRTRLHITLYAHCLSCLKMFSVLPQFCTEPCACCCSDVCRSTYILLFAGLATAVPSPSNYFLPTVEQRCITTREHHDGFERISIGSFMEDNSWKVKYDNEMYEAQERYLNLISSKQTVRSLYNTLGFLFKDTTLVRPTATSSSEQKYCSG